MIQGIEGNPTVFLNGQWQPLSEAKVSVLDRGFIFGDGIYEVVPAYSKRPFRIESHLNRLMRSLTAIRIRSPYDKEQWAALFHEVVTRNAGDDQFVYIQVTRGVAKRDHAFPNPEVTPTVFAMSTAFHQPSQKIRDEGVAVVTLPDERWLHCDIKSTALLGNVLARQSAADRGVMEGVMFRDGFLTEGSSSNVWMVKDGVLCAPIKNHLVLEGIRYGLFEELAAKLGIPLQIRRIRQAEVAGADELMISSATKEVLPVVKMDSRLVGHASHAGKPGPIYKKLRQAYDEAINATRQS
ncbi:MAG: D-amino acid aminotransferase [Betaproteobacteria bacterium]|jgi:D-alanine transaminase|nr:D-amino acid aminotransferase [Betaproteobacteria bacterium]NBT83700.1 D-amino acid aminotransferase [Betaproteobacteria bacterium]